MYYKDLSLYHYWETNYNLQHDNTQQNAGIIGATFI